MAQEEGDKMLARVYNRYLYTSEIQDFFPPGQNQEDSILRANAQIERWVRDALLMHEAERNIPKDLNIDKLVRDYRASLILHNYEQQLIQSALDSVVTKNELQAYYDNNKDQYPLEENILLLEYLKIPNDLETRPELETLWNALDENGNREELKGLCEVYGLEYLLDTTSWINETQASNLLPESAENPATLMAGKPFSTSDSLFTYYVVVMKILPAGEISPLPFIEDQIRMVILHRRRLNILEDRAEDLYDLESRRGNLEIFD